MPDFAIRCFGDGVVERFCSTLRDGINNDFGNSYLWTETIMGSTAISCLIHSVFHYTRL
jgi:hypothetical protein